MDDERRRQLAIEMLADRIADHWGEELDELPDLERSVFMKAATAAFDILKSELPE